jgi:hypothetical protein
LNGDESMCFGSAFIASNSSSSFKVRKVYLTQHPSFGVTIEISPVDSSKTDSSSSSDDEDDTIQYSKTVNLYKTTDFLGQKKSLSLTYNTDMKIDVYAQHSETEREHLSTFTINGISDVADNSIARKEGSSKPKVTLSFELSRSGLV